MRITRTSLGRDEIKGSAETTVTLTLESTEPRPESADVAIECPAGRGRVSPPSLRVLMNPGQTKNLSFIYTARACAVDFSQRADYLALYVFDNGNVIDSSSVQISVFKSFYDYFRMSLRKYRALLGSISTLVSILATIITGILSGLNLPGAVPSLLAVFAVTLALSFVLAGLAAAFANESDAKTMEKLI